MYRTAFHEPSTLTKAYLVSGHWITSSTEHVYMTVITFKDFEMEVWEWKREKE